MATTIAAAAIAATLAMTNPVEAPEQRCIRLSEEARSVMLMRQRGKPLSEALAELSDEDATRQQLVREAYDTPYSWDAEEQVQLRQQFAEQSYASCLESAESNLSTAV